jgi:hypothetical protein
MSPPLSESGHQEERDFGVKERERETETETERM